MEQAVLVAGVRTSIGRLRGALAEFDAPDVGGSSSGRRSVARGRAGRTSTPWSWAMWSRQAPAPTRPGWPPHVVGVPMPVPATTLNKLCLSGLAAVAHAAEVVMLGRHEVVPAGGMESMTGSTYAPRCLAGLRVRWRAAA
jgi:acetyl-CoA C-acetyltransferase